MSIHIARKDDRFGVDDHRIIRPAGHSQSTGTDSVPKARPRQTKSGHAWMWGPRGGACVRCGAKALLRSHGVGPKGGAGAIVTMPDGSEHRVSEMTRAPRCTGDVR